MSLSQAIETIAGVVIDSGLKVHRSLGPGLLESAYEHCLAHELNLRGVKVDRQVSIPVTYEGLQLDVGYRLDMMVEGSVIVEVKTVEALGADSYSPAVDLSETDGASAWPADEFQRDPVQGRPEARDPLTS